MRICIDVAVSQKDKKGLTVSTKSLFYYMLSRISI